MGKNYVEYTSQDVACALGPIGFQKAKPTNDCWEEVYFRDVVGASGKEYPYYVKVYTSVDLRTGTTRDCGADAIRVCLMDKVTGWAVKSAEKRVYRTKSAMENMVDRVRELFKFVFESQKCPKCGAIMVERQSSKGSFMACSHWGPDKPWHCDGKPEKAGKPAKKGLSEELLDFAAWLLPEFDVHVDFDVIEIAISDYLKYKER